ncbi:MAG: NUDIX domain-containing protein [Pseudomonadota bacterium]
MRLHYIARGVAVLGESVLLARDRSASNTFLPGGHIGDGESAPVALRREWQEELGIDVEDTRFLGAVEHRFDKPDGAAHWEINLVFAVSSTDLTPHTPPRSREAHLEFLWAPVPRLQDFRLLPPPMVPLVLSGVETQAFWGSTF